MSDLHGWILEQIGGKETLARNAGTEWWEPWVLRRCAADRKLLTIHKPRGGDLGYDPYVCEGCGQEGYCQDWVTENANDCPVLLAVAEGYGLTPEVLAGLDRPKPEPSTPDGPTIGYVPTEVWEDAIIASLKTTFDIPRVPSPQEKALEILAPELRQVPLYRPSGVDETGE
ncbi:hypothetical protein [Streptomyces sp. NPDC093269]|uniref:hypothetical protein n=1 Tax=Streptomyces sp. NPDC093269 TaxID=3366038 RepID=UPI0038289356